MTKKHLLVLVVCAAFTMGVGPCNLKKNVEIANLNILHGFDCDPDTPADGDQCRVVDRIDLLLAHIVDAGCPDVVTLQENVVNEFVQTGATSSKGPLDSTVALIEAGLPSLEAACGFGYTVVFDPEGATAGGAPRGIDEELILTRYPVLEEETTILYSSLEPFFNRHVLRARIDHPIGPIDVYTTHLASGADAATAPCGFQIIFPTVCPAECVAFGDTVRECQAKQFALLVEATHDVDTPAFLTGDFNAQPGSNEYNEFTGRGWVDSHLEAGNGECEPVSGVNCSSGRNESGGDLEDPTLNVDERIDYIFVVPPGPSSNCTGTLIKHNTPLQFANTGIWAGEPNPFSPTCGVEPDSICWTSDHSGNQVNLSCKNGNSH